MRYRHEPGRGSPSQPVTELNHASLDGHHRRGAGLRLGRENGQRIARARVRSFLERELESAAMVRSHGRKLAPFRFEGKRGHALGLPRRGPRAALRRVRVFVQKAQRAIDLPELLRATQRYFDATLDVQARSEAGDHVEVWLQCEKHGYDGRLSIHSRATTEHDWSDARQAEELGRASGMATLALRCPTIWDVEAVGEDCELARLNLCAILASVALGPVLPDDGATLYGVRGAMERVDRLLRAR